MDGFSPWDVADSSGLVERWWLPEGYQLREFIGRGSFGTVYEVAARTGELFALKRIHLLAPGRRLSSRLASWAARSLRRTLREIACLHALQKLGHPNLVRLCGAWTDVAAAAEKDSGRKAIPAVYLLFERLHPHGHMHGDGSGAAPPTLSHAASMVTQLLGGLASLHESGIVHRDVKPANLLFAAQPARGADAELGPLAAPGQLRLIDFGMARLTQLPAAEVEAEAAEAVAALAAGDPAGAGASHRTPQSPAQPPPPPPDRRFSRDAATASYRSPELVIHSLVCPDDDAAASSAVSAHGAVRTLPALAPSDVWAAGCVFAEMLSRVQYGAGGGGCDGSGGEVGGGGLEGGGGAAAQAVTPLHLSLFGPMAGPAGGSAEGLDDESLDEARDAQLESCPDDSLADILRVVGAEPRAIRGWRRMLGCGVGAHPPTRTPPPTEVAGDDGDGGGGGDAGAKMEERLLEFVGELEPLPARLEQKFAAVAAEGRAGGAALDLLRWLLCPGHAERARSTACLAHPFCVPGATGDSVPKLSAATRAALEELSETAERCSDLQELVSRIQEAVDLVGPPLPQ